MTVKIKAKLPEGEANGLKKQTAALLEQDPSTVGMLVGLYHVATVTTDFEKAEKIPAISFVHVEPILDEVDRMVIREIMARAITRRQNGATQLDIPGTPTVEDLLEKFFPSNDEPAGATDAAPGKNPLDIENPDADEEPGQ